MTTAPPLPGAVVIDPEFAALIPALRDDERAALEASIVAEGCRDALVTWGGVLLDGHNRHAICTEHGLPFRTVEAVGIDSREAAADWIDRNQIGRRNLAPDVAALIRGRIYNRTKKSHGSEPGTNRRDTDEPAEVARAQSEPLQLQAVRPPPRREVNPPPAARTPNPASTFPQPWKPNPPETLPQHPARTAETLAAAAGVSPATIKRDGQFAAAADRLGLAADITAGKVEAPRSAVVEAARMLPDDAPPEVVEEAAEQVRALPHVARASGNDEWYTPAPLIEAARRVMGAIDLDPASSESANRLVGAAAYFDAEADGLGQPWAGRVWMNPPYSRGLVDPFVQRLAEHVETGAVTAAVVLVNNATETGWFGRLLDVASAVCLLRGRVRFLVPDAGPAKTPLQGQAVLYVGADCDRFAEVFGDFGTVLVPHRRASEAA